MKPSLTKRIRVTVSAMVLGVTAIVTAQPAASPLDVQGLDQLAITGARSRGMGGTRIAAGNDAYALFSNPASLSELTAGEVRVSGLLENTQRQQTQNWVPLKTLPGLSVLFQGLSGGIKSPTDTGGNPLSPWETLQKQYDALGPDWKKHSSATRPMAIAAALPVDVWDFKLVAGLGVSRIMDLNHDYQNNNAMTPYYGQERPYAAWSKATDTLHIKWYQYARSRDGSVYGVTPGVAVTLLPDLTLGASVTLLYGSSDDLEQRVERGHLNVAVSQGEPQNFMLDTVYYYQTKNGTSTYGGKILTFGLSFRQERYSIGVTLKPPMALSRTWSRDVTSIDTTAKPFPVRIDSLASRTFHESGKEYVNFPISYALGIVLRPTPKWVIAFDYEVRSLLDVEVTPGSAGTPEHPWVSDRAEWRLGAEYRLNDQLALRAGYREDIQAFAPDGSALVNEPASGDVYSVGAGYVFGNASVDIAYEYANLKYQDVYQSNINYNARDRHTVVMELAYRF
jgi:hypothetical protein